MAEGDPIRIECTACGLSRAFAAGRAPVPLPHHCPRCGADLVVSEGLLVEAAPSPFPEASGAATAPSIRRSEPHFPPPAAWEVATLAAFAALLLWSFQTRGFLAAALAGANLVFHEAGHPIFGLLGSRFLMFLGGTIGQLAFPVAAAVGFARSRRAAPFAVAALWIGFNLVDVGRYAADASARVLPLLAPDEDSHDWWNLLGMLGLRGHDRAIGGTISAAGWALWMGAPAWLAWSWLRERRSSRAVRSRRGRPT